MMTIAAKQALGMNLMKSMRRNKQIKITPPETIVLIGVLEPILSINEDRLNEAEGEYVEKKDPINEPLPKAISS